MANDINAVFTRCYTLAIDRFHEMVTLEHLLATLLEDDAIKQLITSNGGNLHQLTLETTQWLDNPNNNIIVKNTQQVNPPRRTLLIDNVIMKSKTQSVFSGKTSVTSIDLFLAMYGIIDSTASYLIDKYAPPRDKLIESIAKAASKAASENMNPKEAEEILKTYCINLNERAQNGKIDKLIGRESEIENITQILARRTKHNVVLIGDPGVGKTGLVEGLAKRIVEKAVPDILLDTTIWSLDIPSLVAGTKFRGDFEERMKLIINALQSNKSYIAFIDEIHMIMGAGAGGGGQGGGSLDVANMLKPALSRGDIRCIGSTTHEEYRKHFEKDRALVRRFTKVDINEPSIEDSKRILYGISKYYEQYHGITYEKAALDAAVELTAKHIHDRYLPDKAIDIIDSAAAWQRIKPAALRSLAITKADIETEVGRIAKIPAATVKHNEVDKLAGLEKDLKSIVFGQDEAIDNLVNSVYMSRSGLRDSDKTMGAFLFTGPSGVGKTESAKQLAASLGVDFVRFDMSEYQEKHSVSKFIGSPPGYVGYGDGSAGSGLLINALEKSPYCVLLFDEIEKAHQDVFNIFLQMMDNGMISSSNGKTASAKNAIVILTSNLGAASMEKESIGFQSSTVVRDDDTQAVNAFFAPEFRNRLDAIVRFNKLTKENMNRIVDKFINQLNTLSITKGVSIILDKAAKDWLIEKGFDKNMGARPLSRVISENIKKPLSKEMLFGKLQTGGSVMVTVKDDKLEFNYLTQLTDTSMLAVSADKLLQDSVKV
jgi:ATP-dependent Clp protease ATP-binding subunit ClpA